MAIDQSLVARLQRVDVCAVSDALDKLGMRGYVNGLPRLATEARIGGRVVTARLVAKDQVAPTAGPPRHLGTTAIANCLVGDIIVIESRSGIEAGSWGGILTLGAKLKGVAGVISDGLVRDIDESREHGFPVFARGTTARTARGRIAEAGNQCPVAIGDVTVHPGDYVLADGSGVAFIAAADIERVLAAAEAIAAREAAMAGALKSGQAIHEVMGASYEHMLKKD
ncbi:MAG: RraA family protein [Burkholderiales bacterium]|nr:RraA family protein [Burkholderiales bacterium]